MDGSSSLNYAILITLILLNALVTLAYAAIANVRPGMLRESAEEGNLGAQRILKLLDLEPRLTITHSLITALIYFGVAMLATVEWVLPTFGADASTNTASGLLAVLALSIVTVILGYVVPESIGSKYTDVLARVLVAPLRALVVLFSPLTSLITILSRLLSNLFGSSDLLNTVTEEEIMTLVDAGHTGGTIEDQEKNMIYSVLQLDQTNARELMVPRMDVIALNLTTSIDDALDSFVNTGYSRIPVYEDNIDNVVGLVYAKDLLTTWRLGEVQDHTSIRDLVRSAYFVPENVPADELLKDLQNRKVHMAVVVDEYGGTSGVVTIENLIEEIVGDIRDEYDQHEEAEYFQTEEGDYIVDAAMDLDDLNTLLNLNLSTEETDTLGGVIYMALGRVPDEGEMVETAFMRLQVIEIDGRRIRKVLVHVKTEDEREQERNEVEDATPDKGEQDDEGGDDDDQDDTVNSTSPLADAS